MANSLLLKLEFAPALSHTTSLSLPYADLRRLSQFWQPNPANEALFLFFIRQFSLSESSPHHHHHQVFSSRS